MNCQAPSEGRRDSVQVANSNMIQRNRAHIAEEAEEELLAKVNSKYIELFGEETNHLGLTEKEFEHLGEEIDFDFHGYMGIPPNIEILEVELKRVYHQIICLGGSPFMDIPGGTGMTLIEADLLSEIRKIITRNFKTDMLRAKKRFKWWQIQQHRNLNINAKRRLDRPR